MAQKDGTVTDVTGPACHRPVTKAFDLVRTEVSERANFDILEAPRPSGRCVEIPWGGFWMGKIYQTKFQMPIWCDDSPIFNGDFAWLS